MNAAETDDRTPSPATTWAVDELLDDRRIRVLLTCGAGGVGKTTVSAALALRAAERGRRVVVLTIDPAKRLATALGLDELGNDPTPVQGAAVPGPGALDALMLDMKRSFDAAVLAHTSPERAQTLLDNPFYVALSTSFSGTQEYIAMDRLGQLHGSKGPDGRPRWDLLVVDTPPSVSALDFLDAPRRLGQLLDSRLLQLITAPARGGLRLLGVGMGMLTPLLSALVGQQALRDLQTFVGASDAVLQGFRERGDRMRAVLSTPESACVIVSTGDAASLREAGVLSARLRSERIRTAGVVINRAAPLLEPLHDNAERRDASAEWARASYTASRERGLRERERIAAALPGMPSATLPEFATEITSLAQLRNFGAHLADGVG